MRILVTGGHGLIGSALIARLARLGHEVTATARTPSRRPIPGAARVVSVDFETVTIGDWGNLLEGMDAVVNCVGILSDTGSSTSEGAHVLGPKRLFEACELEGVRRVVHISAIGVDRGALSDYSRTKYTGDMALIARDLDWVILRPSLVVGERAFGGGALMRGLAALPILPVLPGTGPLQVVQLEDLIETIVAVLAPGAGSRLTIDVAGPEPLSMSDIAALYREWLGWRPAWRMPVPHWLARLAFALGEGVRRLGWPSPIGWTAAAEMARGAVGDNRAMIALLRRNPQSLKDALASRQSSVQERWFARLYVLKPFVIGALALFFIATGLVSLGPGWEIGMDDLAKGNVGELAPLVIIAGALADLVIGIGIAIRRTAKPALYAALVLSLAYAVAGTLVRPDLWYDPLAPMLKILPIIALVMTAIAIVDER